MKFSVRETLMALADHGLRIADAAQSIYLSRNALVHRVKVIRDATGLNPLDFWDMQKLVEMYSDEEEK